MTRAAVLLAVALSVVWMSGCGTLMNLPDLSGMEVLDMTPDQRVYGGVLRDAEFGAESLKNTVSAEGKGGRLDSLVASAYLLLVDLPLSAVGDTLTLPITLRASQKRSERMNDLTEEKPALDGPWVDWGD